MRMIQKLTRQLVIGAFLALAGAGLSRAAADPGPAEVAARLQTTYNSTTCISTDFRQVTVMNLDRRTRQGAGTLIFMKPGLMRWDYRNPDRQVLISDGQTIRMYFEKSRQMIVTSAREYLQSDVTYSFFAGTGNISQDFKILPPDPDPAAAATAGAAIKLIPKAAHPQIDHLHIWVDRDSYLIRRLQIVDHFQTVTDLFFDNLKTDCTVGKDKDADSGAGQRMDMKMFNFTPPPGTEIIEQ